MQSWNNRFDALEISQLRSPAFVHPVAFDPPALVDFAVREGRTSELMDAPATCGECATGVARRTGRPLCKGSWLVTTDLSERGALLKRLPSTALFRDFCASLEARLPHRWFSGKATRVCKDSSTGKFGVHYRAADGREVSCAGFEPPAF